MLALAAAPLAPALAQENGAVSIVRDTEIEEILHQEADPIFVAAGLDPKHVEIHIVGDKELNAFSGAGLNLYLNTGIILETKTPNQLIGVIAHETGHIAGGHIARSGAATKAALGPMLVGIGLGILAAAAGSPDGAAALVFSSTYFGEIGVLGYSREQESRADQAASTYLEKAGVSGRGLVDFFNTFRYQEVFDDERKYPYLRDHPLTDDRIEALAARVDQQPHVGVVDSPEALARHALMKAKLEGSPGRPISDPHRLSRVGPIVPSPLRPRYRLLQGNPHRQGGKGHRRSDHRATQRSLLVGAQRSGAVRGWTAQGG